MRCVRSFNPSWFWPVLNLTYLTGCKAPTQHEVNGVITPATSIDAMAGSKFDSPLSESMSIEPELYESGRIRLCQVLLSEGDE